MATSFLNVHKGEDMEPLSPFDLLPGFEKDPEEEEKLKMRKGIKQTWARSVERLPLDVSQAEADKLKNRLISAAVAEGFDGEEMWLEMFPED